jgi:hypothetical protein
MSKKLPFIIMRHHREGYDDMVIARTFDSKHGRWTMNPDYFKLFPEKEDAEKYRDNFLKGEHVKIVKVSEFGKK